MLPKKKKQNKIEPVKTTKMGGNTMPYNDLFTIDSDGNLVAKQDLLISDITFSKEQIIEETIVDEFDLKNEKIILMCKRVKNMIQIVGIANPS
ncbi:MAG: hypothetical protein H7Y13_17675 [Sphingobacteriaceae bacterium]|nr:hypothetical protein [Sphingobacteriaceae bacterium]